MARYPVILEHDDNDTLMVSFPDFPEAQTYGDDHDEALARAVDALQTIIEAYIKDRRPIPAPSPIAGESVELSAMASAKVDLYRAMHAQGLNKTGLARRMKVHMPQVDRLFDIRHGSKMDQLEAAAVAMGGHLDVSLRMPHHVPIHSKFVKKLTRSRRRFARKGAGKKR